MSNRYTVIEMMVKKLRFRRGNIAKRAFEAIAPALEIKMSKSRAVYING